MKLSILLLTVIVVIGVGFYLVSRRDVLPISPYGVSFSKLHADELGLEWKEVYLALLDDLGVRKLRLSAHWPMIEPEEDRFSFEELDFQMQEAEKRGAKVILAVGRKTPGWPECHTPVWIEGKSVEEERRHRLSYIQAIVERYRDSSALHRFQVENEPFLNYARHLCGEPDEKFFAQEVALVRSLDPHHPIVVTDGGEFGLWYKARSHADVFGSTMYLYVYTHYLGYFRYPISGAFFRLKQNILDILTGEKPSISIEVGLEPWLNQPIVETTLEEQLQRMNMGRFEEILLVARESGFSEHYLWGAEWWYYMKLKGHPEFWERARSEFTSND